jgi:hypothetical protein
MTTFKIGQTVSRANPGGGETTHQIKTPEEVKYHTELAARGYKYTVIDGAEDEFDFALPTVEAIQATAPRVHPGGSVCVGCEG